MIQPGFHSTFPCRGNEAEGRSNRTTTNNALYLFLLLGVLFFFAAATITTLPPTANTIQEETSIMISAKALQATGLILEAIERQDWTAFRSVALSNPAYFQAISRFFASHPEFHGMTLLHAVVRCNPPLDIVAKMIEICPEQPAAKDCLGRTALHVAAASAASPKVIKLIAHACPTSCDATDEDGKTPLHFACDVTCKLFEGDSDSIPTAVPRKVCHDTIRALLSESIHASTIEDIDEMNALEYAIMSDAELKTVKMLQKASTRSFESESSQPSIQPSIESLSLLPMRTATPPLRVSLEGNEIKLEGSRVPYV